MRKILAAFTDTHGNNSRGLLNPNIVLEREDESRNSISYSPAPTPTQVYLWRLFGWCKEALVKIAGKDPIIAAHMGDECQGNKYICDHVSARLDDEILIAASNLGEIASVPNVEQFILIQGTEAHTYPTGSSTRLVKNLLQNQYQNVEFEATTHCLTSIDGYEVDMAHHGPPPGSREHLIGNVARFYLRSLMDHDIRTRGRCPDLVLRGHWHEPAWVSLEMEGRDFKLHHSELHLLPPFCGMDDHSTQATKSKDSMTFGMLVKEIIDGKVGREWRLYDTIDLRRRITC